jgi:hypothetical protein
MTNPQEHASTEVLRSYANGDPELSPDVEWAVEVHLEQCGDCRVVLAAEATAVTPLLDQVWAGVAPDTTPAPVRRRRQLATWATPAMVPVLAVVVDRFASQTYPSLALLLAPIAPVAGVAAAWARGLDPAHEVVTATPRAGLQLVLRRTVAVLLVVVPLLALSTWASPARWLLPCLTFTVATLALGSFVGVRRAAIGLLTTWTAFVIGPTLVTGRVPVVFEPAALGVWAAVLVAGMAVVRLRAGVYSRLDIS